MIESDFTGEWFNADVSKPEEGQKVLLHLVYEKFVAGAVCEIETVVSGGIRDGCWMIGDAQILWDFDYNLHFCDDDVKHWMPLPHPPK